MKPKEPMKRMERQRETVHRLRENPRRLKQILWTERGMIAVAYGAYIGLLVYLAYTNVLRCLQIILITAVPFGVVSVFRLLLDQKRPYEIWGEEPLVPRRHGGGKSFPSRHVCSMTLIATVLCPYCVWGAALLFLLGILLARCRVILGMHFVRDVTAGYATGIVLALVGLWVIL